jgi:ABC-2 type transport system permease protein
MNTMTMLVKRELWEHRSLWIAPLVWVGVIILLSSWGVLLASNHVDVDHIPDRPAIEQGQDPDSSSEGALLKDESRKQSFSTAGYLIINAMVSGFATIVVFFYLIDCLFTERRDRSILFWKSLPLSDTQVVLSKLATAMVVVPVGVLLLSAATQFVMYCIVWLGFHGTAVGALMPDWDFISWMRSQLIGVELMIGGLLWYAPIAAYFLLLSVWARRLVFLWAVVPLIAAPFLEWVFLGSHHLAEFLSNRFGGYIPKMHAQDAFQKGGEHVPRVEEIFASVDLSAIFASLEMWLGLVAAAAMIYATIRIRRYRDEA